MNISEKFKECKEKFRIYEKDIFFVFLIILAAFSSFGLGRLSRIFESKNPVMVENAVEADNFNFSNSEVVRRDIAALNLNEKASAEEKVFVASKNGTKYYFPWCKGAEKIKEENKVWFATKEEAEAKGYGPAQGCKGL